MGRHGERPRLSRPASIGLFLLIACHSGAGPVASESVRHFVYGLNPRFPYEVASAEDTLLTSGSVGPAGDLLFESRPGSSIRILVPEPNPPREEQISIEGRRGILGPCPNPARGTTRVVVTSDVAGEARFRMYGISGARRLLDLTARIDPGITPIQLDLPPRAAAGLYLIGIDLPWGRETCKILLLGP